MVFTYELVKEYEDAQGGIDAYSVGEIEYEPSYYELGEGLAELIYEDYFRKSLKENGCNCYSPITKAIFDFLYNNDLIDDLADTYKDELKEHFEDKAKENC